jgi:20S proteasome alpha/beta subunit
VSSIAGVLFRGGVVIASDSAATTEIEKVVTAVHQMRKIEVINGRLVLAITGASGVGQQYQFAMSRMLELEDLSNASPEQVLQYIIDHKCKALKGILGVAKARKELGQDFDATNFAAESLIAIRVNGSARLYRFFPDVTGELVLQASPFVVIGSGAQTVSAFIEYLRRNFLGGEIPELADAILTLLWGINFAQATGVRDVGGDPQVTVVPDDPSLPISQLDNDELSEHRDILTRAEFMLGELRRAVRGESIVFGGKSKIPE